MFHALIWLAAVAALVLWSFAAWALHAAAVPVVTSTF